MKKLIKLSIILFILIAIILCSYKFIESTKKEEKSTTLFLGDSITQRYKLDKYFFNYKTINSGVGGNTTNDILNDIDERVNKYNFDKVFLLVGINDLLWFGYRGRVLRRKKENRNACNRYKGSGI